MPDTPDTQDVPEPSRTTAYGAGPDRVYDVRLPPSGAPKGTVVIVHGGFWRAATDRSHAADQAQAFADDGFAVAVVEYNRTGMPGGGWPGTFDDVQAAVVAIAADKELPDPLIAVGHSAGGHLVGLLAGRGDAAAGALAAVVSLGGCVDLTLSAEMSLGEGAAQAFMGGGPADLPDRYAAADPALNLPASVPVHLVHGAEDDVVPPVISQSYVRAAAARGVKVPLTVISGGDHFGLTDPDHPDFAVVLDIVREMAAAGSTGGAP